MTTLAEMGHLTDAVASLRFCRMALATKALEKQGSDRELLAVGADAAQSLADEYAEIAAFLSAMGVVEAA